MNEYWDRRPDLDAEIQSVMGTSELEVYLDPPHSCIHIMRGGMEFTSALWPMDDSIREDLRQQSFLLHNGINEDEVRRVAEANARVDQYNEMQREEAKDDWRKESIWDYEHMVLDKGLKPFIIVPGGQNDG